MVNMNILKHFLSALGRVRFRQFLPQTASVALTLVGLLIGAHAQNIVPNGGFENGGTSWILDGSSEDAAASSDFNNSDVAEGSKAFKINMSNRGSFGFFLSSGKFKFQEGSENTLAFFAKSNVATGSLIDVFIETEDVSPDDPERRLFTELIELTNEYELIEIEIPAFAAVREYKVVFRFETQGRDYFIDGVRIGEAALELTGIPGDKSVTLQWPAATGATAVKLLQRVGADTNPFTEVLAGTLNATSTSALLTNLVNGTTYTYKLAITGGNFEGESKEVNVIPGPNNLLNPGFEFQLVNWTTLIQQGAAATITAPNANAFAGARAALAEVTSVGTTTPEDNVQLISNLFPVTTGGAYLYSFWGKVATGTTKKIIVQLQSADGLSTIGKQEFTLTDQWKFFFGNVPTVLKEDTYRLQFLFTQAGSFSLDNVYIGKPDIDAICASGTIATTSRAVVENVCIGDDQEDFIAFVRRNGQSDDFVFLITDTDNKIISTFEESVFDFDDDKTGEIRVWGLGYRGLLSAPVGLDIDSAILAVGCYDLTNEFVSIVKDVADGGRVTTMSNDTTVTICLNDPTPSRVRVNANTKSKFRYTYLVTDKNNVVISSQDSASFNFNTFNKGEYRIWGISYAGRLSVIPGRSANTISVIDGCFDLSANFVKVTLDSVAGATIRTRDNKTLVNVCVGQTVNQTFKLLTSSNNAGLYRYIVTDLTNKILAVLPTDSVIVRDLRIPVEASVRIWGVAYNGTFATNLVNQGADTAVFSNGCYDLSSNNVTVSSSSANGGTIIGSVPNSIIRGSTVAVCATDRQPDVITLARNTNANNASYIYLVTDPDNKIVARFDTNVIDLSQVNRTLFRVWGLSYTGQLTADVGKDADSISLSTICFSLSANFITISKDPTVCNTVSIEDGLTLNGLTVYPNPVVGRLQVQFTPKVRVGKTTAVSVYDLTGKRVSTQSFVTAPTGNNEFVVDVANLPKGFYLVRLENDGKFATGRFVKE